MSDIMNELTEEEKQSLSQLSGSEGRKRQGKYGVVCYTAEELVNMQLPPVKFIVDDLLPEGLTVLAGAPKIGKSWFVMGLCVAVSSGSLFLDKINVKPATCLYLALEDNERRLSTRLKLVLRGRETPANLHISPTWPRIDQGGADLLSKFMEKHPDTKLIAIDTLAKIRPRSGSRNKTLYDIDYEAMEPLKAIADKFGIAVVIIHHTRKSGADDKFDEISGTTGLTGGTDGMMVLKKDRAQCDAVLFVSGRDVMDKELALKWNADTTSWSIMGSAEEYRMSEERRAIREFLSTCTEPLSSKDIAVALNKNPNTIRFNLMNMYKDGQVLKEGRGRYYINTTTYTTTITNKQIQQVQQSNMFDVCCSNDKTDTTTANPIEIGASKDTCCNVVDVVPDEDIPEWVKEAEKLDGQ